MKGEAFLKQVAGKPPFSKMHPRMAGFFKEYLSREKVIPFGDRMVLNTHFPPYPSPAFDKMVCQFNEIGETSARRLYSVTLAVTNRCRYDCWHCYNIGRSQIDLPLSTLKEAVSQIQELGAVTVTLSGGEPLLRDDLEEIIQLFDDSVSLTLNTTGDGLTPERVRRLRDSGLFAVGVSLDSIHPEEHDRMRGKTGAFQIARQALQWTAENGLYPYIISVATRDFLQPSHFKSFMKFASTAGALEVHLLEPSPTGKLAGNTEVRLHRAEKQQILDYQNEVAADETLPILSTFTYLESSETFGCGAGLTHLYIDGGGEVCPCNLVPLSFGNLTRESLPSILARMGQHFQKPRPSCIGHILSPYIHTDRYPTTPAESTKICKKFLPGSHAVPRFFQIRSEALSEVGKEELRSAYDQVFGYYDEYWLTEAAQPIQDLVNRLTFTGHEHIFEAACGTGYATALLANRLQKSGKIVAADLSEGMLTQARNRLRKDGFADIQFIQGEALECMKQHAPFDLIFSSWALGYIPLQPFLQTSASALRESGQLAFVVHKENSPYLPLEIFTELVAEDPSVLQKRVAFDFPRDMDYTAEIIQKAKLKVLHLWDGKIVFRCSTPEQVLEHLLKSGAGTAYYDAVDPTRRKSLEAEFFKRLAARNPIKSHYEVIHDYISCIAGK